MSPVPSSGRPGLFTAPCEDPAIAACFDDAAWIAAFVQVEAALARAQAGAGLLSGDIAEEIAARCATFRPDFAALAAATARDGFPIIGLVAQLRAHVGAAAADRVHRGATTQDIVDTALVGRLGAALGLCDAHLAALIRSLAALAERHRRTLMVGRTHLQPALPVTFGLKAAAWLAPLLRHRERLAALRPRLLVVQFGGAAGTLASLGESGPAVASALARELRLGLPLMPWHAQRDTLLETAGWLALVNSSLSKFAQDILLLTQFEVAEVAESTDRTEGGSSAMPQKRNPVASETIVLAARSAAVHARALLDAPAPEHERGTQAGQFELMHLPRALILTGGALRAALRLAAGLVVDPARMKSNLDATRGVLLAEAATLALAQHMDVSEARKMVAAACAAVATEQRHLIDLLRERTAAPVDWAGLRDESGHLGVADQFITRVLAAAAPPPVSP